MAKSTRGVARVQPLARPASHTFVWYEDRSEGRAWAYVVDAPQAARARTLANQAFKLVVGPFAARRMWFKCDEADLDNQLRDRRLVLAAVYDVHPGSLPVARKRGSK